MKTKLTSGIVVVLLAVCLGVVVRPAAAQQVHYVAPDGDDSNPGTFEAPRATLPVAQAYMSPGDTLYLRGGTYAWPTEPNLSVDGEEGAPLYLWAYPGETPVLDFAGNDGRGLRVRGDFWHLKGFIVQNAADNGIHISGSDNIVEQVVVRYNGDSGLQMDSGASRNLILNVDSYENYDPQNNGENADGFAAKFDVGEGNIFRGTRAYRNADDGFDMWNRENLAGYRVTVEDSWAFENGVNRWDDPNFQGDGNGYKLGQGTGAHLLVRVLAWGNVKHGIDVNGNQTGVTVYNSSAYANGGRNFYFDERNSAHVLRNNISHGSTVNIYPEIDDTFNSWNEGFTTTEADFLSTDPIGLDGPRQADGSLPATDFLHLAPSSPLVNAGTDVGLAFLGAAPDLGAFETAVGVATDEVAAGIPNQVQLLPAYPNPVRSATTLAFELAEAGPVRLAVYDALGRRIAVVLDTSLPAGRHQARWAAAAQLPSGLYIARVETPTAQATQRLLLVR